jgi:hypothetical protein
MITRRNLFLGVFAAAVSSCAWLTGTRRRGRRRGRRRTKRAQTTNDRSPNELQFVVDELELGDVLVIDDNEEFEVLAFSPDASQALLKNTSGQQSWVALAWER